MKSMNKNTKLNERFRSNDSVDIFLMKPILIFYIKIKITTFLWKIIIEQIEIKKDIIFH